MRLLSSDNVGSSARIADVERNRHLCGRLGGGIRRIADPIHSRLNEKRSRTAVYGDERLRLVAVTDIGFDHI